MGNDVHIFCIYADKENCYPELMKDLQIFPLRKGLSYSALRKSYLLSRRSRRIHFLLKELNYYLDFINFRKLADIPPRNGDYDIINCHNFPTEWAGYRAKERLDLPVSWMCNEPPFWYFQPTPFRFVSSPLYLLYDKRAVSAVDEIVVLDELNRKRVMDIYSRESVVIRSGVDHERFGRAKGDHIRESLKVKPEEILLLQVGTLKQYKRQEDSIRALSTIRNGSRTKLVFVGQGEEYQKLVSLSNQLGVGDRVMFAQNVDDDALADYYAACDIFLFPSNQTWGLVVTEAMAAGKCCIVSRLSGVSEIIDHKVNGMIINDYKEMAEMIDLLIENPDIRKNIGGHAREYIRSELSWTAYTKKMLSRFEVLIRSKK